MEDGILTKKRVQSFHRTKAQAEGEAQRLRTRRERLGAIAFRLDVSALADAIEAGEIVSWRVSFREMAEFYQIHHPVAGTVSVSNLYEEYLVAKQGQSLATSTLADIRYKCSKFVSQFGESPLTMLDAKSIENWLDTDVSRNPRSRAGFVVQVQAMLNFAVKRGYIGVNPMKDVFNRGSRAVTEDPCFLRTEDVRRILATAMAYDEKQGQSMTPSLAIGFMCGLRSAEVLRCQWEMIDWVEKEIRLPAGITKKRRVNIVPMPDNLIPWLTRYRRSSGPVTLSSKPWNHHRREICALAGVKWVDNAMRHTFATMHAKHYRDAALTAFVLGHKGDSSILYNHYMNQTVTRDEAATYWGIKPVQSGTANLRRIA